MTPFSSVVPGTTSTLIPAAPPKRQRKPNKPKRTLPPDAFDTIELMALAFGGIGGGFDFFKPGGECPWCVHGLAREAGAMIQVYRYQDGADVALVCPPERAPDNNEINEALFDAGIERDVNDRAVAAINWRLGRDAGDRVTFKRWCRELGVVRGEANN